ncbi:MAG: RDD family protein [Acidimicrobiia bacterium]
MQVRALFRRLFCADLDALDAVEIGRPPELASPRSRMAAAAIDVTLMIIALHWVGALGPDPAFGGGGGQVRIVARLLAWVAILGHLVVLEGSSGQTFGKRFVGIQVVKEETGGPIGYGVAAHRVWARATFWFVSFLALADPLLQTLHDRSAGTVVVKVPPASGPEPRLEHLEYETTDEA